MKPIRLILVAAAMSLSGPLHAETLRVGGIYPATSDAAAAVRALSVEPFGGEVGPELSFKVEDVLRAATLRGESWYQVIPGPAGNVDATLRGTAYSEQRITDYTEEHERCINDAKGNCTQATEKFQARCKRRVIDLIVRIRLIAPDGRLLWSDDRPESNTDSWCEDSEKAPRPRSAVARSLAERVAIRLRNDFVPREFSEDIRLDENRKGLAKADADLSKAALKKVKQRAAGQACADWRSLAARSPQHMPTLYNVGLCAESAGDYAGAAELYGQVAAGDPRHDKARSGLGRIAARERAQRQAEAHSAD